jgi:hypothetical protein
VWFRGLTGFAETDGDTVRSRLRLEGAHLISLANGRAIGVGTLTTPSLAELRSRTDDTGPGDVSEVVADVADLHTDPAHAGATFQVASQFNLLEMPSPGRTPDHGVSDYEHDHTQGPACAISCGGGTIYRNWFAPVGNQLGQSAQHQIDCLADLGTALGNVDGSLWAMTNGYCLASSSGLDRITTLLAGATAPERQRLMGLLRIGLHADVEVTRNDAGHHVTQIYGSALPVAYGQPPSHEWEPFARLVLDASYEATLRAAQLTAAETGNTTVFLTLLGGGVFGNDRTWIEDALDRACRLVGRGLDVRLVQRPSTWHS